MMNGRLPDQYFSNAQSSTLTLYQNRLSVYAIRDKAFGKERKFKQNWAGLENFDI